MQTLYSSSEISNLYYMLLEKIILQPKSAIILNRNTKLSIFQKKQFAEAVEKLKNHFPIQYIIGKANFMDYEFEVNSSVLIPRPETEELVEWIVNDNRNSQKINILDIGTGSACIAVSLKKLLPQSSVFAIDISDEALETAKNNAKLNNVEINFSKTDILQNPLFSSQFDIIVSNPPYITESEKPEMSASVLDFEPNLALFVPNASPLIFYEKIMQFAKTHLTASGKIYFEINRSKGQEIFNLATQNGFCDCLLRKDISGNDRMLRASK